MNRVRELVRNAFSDSGRLESRRSAMYAAWILILEGEFDMAELVHAVLLKSEGWQEDWEFLCRSLSLETVSISQTMRFTRPARRMTKYFMYSHVAESLFGHTNEMSSTERDLEVLRYLRDVLVSDFKTAEQTLCDLQSCIVFMDARYRRPEFLRLAISVCEDPCETVRRVKDCIPIVRHLSGLRPETVE